MRYTRVERDTRRLIGGGEGGPPLKRAQSLSDQLPDVLLRKGVWPLLTLLTRTTAQEAKAGFVVELAR